MNFDFLIGASIVVLGSWALAGFVIFLARQELKRRSRSTGIAT